MKSIIKQYQAIKAKYKDAILLFRIDDYYMAIEQDAEAIASILGLNIHKDEEGKTIQWAKFPQFSLDYHLHKLVKHGYKVAICEELEDPKK